LKASGEIKAFGAGVNHVGTMSQFLDVMELDFFLVSQIYTLMHHGNISTFGLPTMLDNPFPGERNLNDVEGGALAEFNRVHARGMGVIVRISVVVCSVLYLSMVISFHPRVEVLDHPCLQP
jgi:hypothetical protein